MATASDVVNRALTKAGIRADESTVTASQMNDGTDALNDMLISWENSGILLGFQPVSNSADEIRVPRHALAAIKSNLAVFLAGEYGRPANAILLAEAISTKDDLLTSLVQVGDVEYPSTLPQGSGNHYYDDDLRLFPESKNENF